MTAILESLARAYALHVQTGGGATFAAAYHESKAYRAACDALAAARLTSAESAAIAKHGESVALQALAMNEGDGEGPSTIAFHLGLSFREADALISAGRKLSALS
jgi:hypothetical protein